MSGPAQLSYVTAVCSPGRWGVMGSSQFSRIVQKYTGHIHRGVYTHLMLFLKFHEWAFAPNLDVSGEGKMTHHFVFYIPTSCEMWHVKPSYSEVSKLC